MPVNIHKKVAHPKSKESFVKMLLRCSENQLYVLKCWSELEDSKDLILGLCVLVNIINLCLTHSAYYG